MGQITITAPNPAYNGVSAGVRFTDGKATITERDHAALEYFSRHRFGISEDAPAPEDAPELAVGKQGDPAPDLTDAERLAKLTGDELDKIAAEHTPQPISLEGAKNKAEKAAFIVSAHAAQLAAGSGVVNSGPVGPQHNAGRDGADPANGDPPITPVDTAGL